MAYALGFGQAGNGRLTGTSDSLLLDFKVYGITTPPDPTISGTLKYTIRDTSSTIVITTYDHTINISGTALNPIYDGIDRLPWEDVWQKYLYAKLELIVDGTPVSVTSPFGSAEMYIFTDFAFNNNYDQISFFNSGTTAQFVLGVTAPAAYQAFYQNPAWTLLYDINGVQKTITINSLITPHFYIPKEGQTSGSIEALSVTFTADNWPTKTVTAAIDSPRAFPVFFLYTNTQTLTAASPNVSYTTLTYCRGVHGSIMIGNKIWGGCRNYASTEPNNVVIVDRDNFANVTKLQFVNSTGGVLSTIEQLKKVGDYVYCLTSTGLIQISILDYSYKFFENAPNESTNFIPIDVDDEYLYIFHSGPSYRGLAYKFRESDFRASGIPQYNQLSDFTPVATITIPLPSSDSNDFIHSLVNDTDYLYPAFTANLSSDPDPQNGKLLAKIRKSDFTIVGTTRIPQSTDDATIDEDYLYYGVEITPAPTETVMGFHYGAYAVRKSDLEVFSLRLLGKGDTSNTPAVTSYASIIFGQYLVDFKTNKRIYVLDRSTPSEWSFTEPCAKHLVKDVDYASFSQIGIINDVMLDYDTQTFYAFVWNSNGQLDSQIIKFKITDLDFFTVPSVETSEAELESGRTITFSGIINSTGGQEITSAGFRYGTTSDDLNFSSSIVDFTLGQKTKDVELDESIGSTFYYQFYAVNSEGEGAGTIRTFNFPEDTNPNPFPLGGIVGVEISTLVSSSLVTITGINVPVPVFVSSGEYRINGGEWLSDPSVLENEDTLQLRELSPATYSTEDVITATVGGRSETWTIITRPEPTTDVYGMSGIVKHNGVVQVGATIILIDISTNEIVLTTQTDEDGRYTFSDLIQDREYLVTGYKEDYRAISKIKQPYIL